MALVHTFGDCSLSHLFAKVYDDAQYWKIGQAECSRCLQAVCLDRRERKIPHAPPHL
jgi:hypothetical protein